jgi:O-antigen/teichoic acid export membrane protein
MNKKENTVFDPANDGREENLQEHPLYNRISSISRQWIVVFSGKISQQILSFLIGVVIAKTLGSAELGIYQIGIVITHLLASLAIMGADRGLVRYIPIFRKENLGKALRLIHDSLGITFLVSVVLSAALFTAAGAIGSYFFHSSHVGTALRVFAFYLPAYALFCLLVSIFDGLKRADIETLVQNILTPGIYFLLLVGISIIAPRIVSVILARIIVYGLSCVILAVLARSGFKTLFKAESQPYNIKAFYAFSAPLFLMTALHMLMSHVDILLTGYFLTTEKVGVYAIASRMAMLSLLGLQAVNIIFAPHVSEMFNENKIRDINLMFKLFTRWTFLFSLGLFAFFALFRHQLLSYFGPEFASGQIALVLLAFGHMINALGGPNGTILIMTGNQKWMLYNSVFMLVCNVVFNIVFIPKWGINGAAFATCLSIIIVNILKTIQLYLILKIHPYDRYYIPSIIVVSAAAVMSWVVHHLLHFRHLAAAVIGGFVFLASFILLYWLFGRNSEDRLLLAFVRGSLKERRRKS